MPNIQDLLPTTNPQIFGQRLQAARKAAGLTQERAAELLHMSSRSPLIAIEQGTRLPTIEEFYEMTRIYAVLPHELFRQQPPPEPILLQFRRTDRVSDKEDRLFKKQLSELQQLCDDYLELERLGGRSVPRVQAPVYPLSGVSMRQAGENAAQAERSRLGLGDAPSLNILDIIESQGIALFHIEFPGKIAGLYVNTVHQSESVAEVVERACIAINTKHPAHRRRWSIAHEYGHFVSRRNVAEPIVDYIGDTEREQEQFADAFAQSFLLPQSSVTRHYWEIKQEHGKFSPADLCRLAHYFAVSPEAMGYRLEGLQLIGRGKYRRMVEDGFSPTEASEMLGLKPQDLDNRMLPLRYMYLASEAFHRHLISTEIYARFLRVDVQQMRQWDRQLRTDYTVANDGQIHRLAISLNDDDTGVQQG